METAEHDSDLNKLGELKYGRLPDLQKQLQELEKEEHAEDRLLKEEVDEDDIAKVVSTWTGIPVSRLMEGEKKKLAHLDEILHQRVIGQDEAVDALAKAGFDPAIGARPLKRLIVHSVETIVSQKIVQGDIVSGDHLKVVLKNGKIDVVKA